MKSNERICAHEGCKKLSKRGKLWCTPHLKTRLACGGGVSTLFQYVYSRGLGNAIKSAGILERVIKRSTNRVWHGRVVTVPAEPLTTERLNKVTQGVISDE